jgi:hypothetical protein
MISEILAGLAILKPYKPEAPIVTAAYILCIPAIPFDDVTEGTDAALLLELNWFQHPVYACYAYRTKTITELKDVDGAGDKDLPAYPVTLPSYS